MLYRVTLMTLQYVLSVVTAALPAMQIVRLIMVTVSVGYQMCVRHNVVFVKRLMYKEYMIAFDTQNALGTSNVKEDRMQVRRIATIAPVKTKVVGVPHLPQLVVKQLVIGVVN
jgi:hypothetical protein